MCACVCVMRRLMRISVPTASLSVCSAVSGCKLSQSLPLFYQLSTFDRVGFSKLKRTGHNDVTGDISRDVIDRSRFPELRECDVEERFVRGSGPGGQSVNKTANCVALRHIPTGLRVKCHESRSLEMNRRQARQQLLAQLDQMLNGDMAVERQQQRILQRKLDKNRSQRHRRQTRKLNWLKLHRPEDN